MERRPILGQLVLLAVAVLLLIGSALLLRTHRPQTVLLPDGAELTLEAVTYGKEHRHWSGSAWQRLLGPLVSMLPPGFRGSGLLTYSSTNDTICFWLRERTPFATNAHRSFYVVDEHSRNALGSSWSTTSSSSPTNLVRGYAFHSFPRRGGKILLHEYEWDQNWNQRSRLAEFTTPNPARGPFPVWQPRPLPLTSTNGDLEFTLTQFKNGVSARHANPTRATNAHDAAVLASFRVAQRGQPLTNWQPVGIEARDATGNQAGNTSWSQSTKDGEETMTYQSGLWPGEPAWRLRVEFSRRSGYTPGELWTVRGIQATGILVSNFWPTNALARTNLCNSRLEIFPLRYGPTGQEGIELKVNVTPLPPDLRLTLVKVTDEQGRELNSGGISYGGGEYKFHLTLLSNSMALDVTVALHQSRFVEYLAQPEEK